MAEQLAWMYLIHPPREDFVATITPEEAIMNADPAITSGLMAGELRRMRVRFLRGRD